MTTAIQVVITMIPVIRHAPITTQITVIPVAETSAANAIRSRIVMTMKRASKQNATALTE
jgi:hypothetical protein